MNSWHRERHRAVQTDVATDIELTQSGHTQGGSKIKILYVGRGAGPREG
jgi:hypothetical protein